MQAATPCCFQILDNGSFSTCLILALAMIAHTGLDE